MINSFYERNRSGLSLTPHPVIQEEAFLALGTVFVLKKIPSE